MKKIYFILLAVLMTISAHAQTGVLTPKIDFYENDNSMIAGKWYKTKSTFMDFHEDGTVDGYWPDRTLEYKFFPSQGRIVTFNGGAYWNSLDVVYLNDETMVVKRLEGYFETYTRTRPVQEVIALSICDEATGKIVSSLEMTMNNGVGSTQQLRASIRPDDADNQEVEWSSNDEKVVTVENGLVKAVGAGTATITCAATDGSGVTGTCRVTVSNLVTSITLSSTSFILMKGKSTTLTAEVSPSDATNQKLTWSSGNTSVATVSTSGVVTAIDYGASLITCEATDGSGVKATCIITVKNLNGSESGHTWVDLGLSVKWATMNIGASSSTSYGSYFAWGEVETKNNYDWSTYKWYINPTGKISKYNTAHQYSGPVPDGKSTLEPEDDAANAKWGGKWRMPTRNEFEELCSKCTWTWTTQNGSIGYLVTAPSGASIFLPTAGQKNGTVIENRSIIGYYWSSSLVTPTTDALKSWYLEFDGNRAFTTYPDGGSRCLGHSVRAVCE
ncbi:MAG: Ig domain-containing protein [Bacteroidaceae bacterium]|nr:Ig domain-containing protein [Bacteroidaceae bacterium]